MISLSGLTLKDEDHPEGDIAIEITGLRPGEKLYEELLANSENTIPTHHSKIMIAKVREYEFNSIKKDFVEVFRVFS